MARKRATIIVLDSAGIGYLPDAAEFGDVGANTFCNIYKSAVIWIYQICALLV